MRHAARAALSARPRPVVAVLGAYAEGLRAALADLDLIVVENSSFADGLSGSLRAGLAALPRRCMAAVVLLADMPRITSGHIDRLADAFDRAEPEPSAVVPLRGGRRGNPVLLNLRLLAPDIAGLTGDRGAGPLLRGRSDVLEVAGDAATILDVDTPAALAALRDGAP